MIVLAGRGLHSGEPSRVTLERTPGPVSLRVGNLASAVRDLSVVRAIRATTVEGHAGALRVSTVEHLFAALAGLGVHRDVLVRVEGPEMPLLDGGASQWCNALSELGAVPSRSPVRVTRSATYEIGRSRYAFASDQDVRVRITFETDDPRLHPHAEWHGDAADFRARIAPARTFAFGRDLGELALEGLARHVDPTAVVLLTEDAIHCTGRVFEADEPARHKLLDLVGDAFLFGGPPRGRVEAWRPGHAANVRAFQLALSEGVLVADGFVS